MITSASSLKNIKFQNRVILVKHRTMDVLEHCEQSVYPGNKWTAILRLERELHHFSCSY